MKYVKQWSTKHLHWKLKNEQHEIYQEPGMNSGVTEG
jgi:hypothetical protein